MEIIAWIIVVAPFVCLWQMMKVRQNDKDRAYGPQGHSSSADAPAMPNGF